MGAFGRRYFRGGAYSDYGPQFYIPWFEDALVGKTVGILGCAYGYGVAHLRERGVDAWGMDISRFALRQAGRTRRYLVHGDATDPQDMERFRRRAGRLARFDVLINEDMAVYLTDAEALEAFAMWRRHARRVVHRLSVHQTFGEGSFRHRDLAYWRSLISRRDRLMVYQTGEVG